MFNEVQPTKEKTNLCLRHRCSVLRYVSYHLQDSNFKRRQLPCMFCCFEFPRMAKLADMPTNLILPGTTVLFLHSSFPGPQRLFFERNEPQKERLLTTGQHISCLEINVDVLASC